MTQATDHLAGIATEERHIMSNLLRMPPEQHKAITKPKNARAEGQRQRRQKEREAANVAQDAS